MEVYNYKTSLLLWKIFKIGDVVKNFRVSFSKNYDKIILECDEKIINSNMNTEKFCKWLMTSELKFEFIGEDKDFEYYKSINGCRCKKI